MHPPILCDWSKTDRQNEKEQKKCIDILNQTSVREKQLQAIDYDEYYLKNQVPPEPVDQVSMHMTIEERVTPLAK